MSMDPYGQSEAAFNVTGRHRLKRKAVLIAGNLQLGAAQAAFKLGSPGGKVFQLPTQTRKSSN